VATMTPDFNTIKSAPTRSLCEAQWSALKAAEAKLPDSKKEHDLLKKHWNELILAVDRPGWKQ